MHPKKMKAKHVEALSWSHPAISSCLVYLGSHAMQSYFIHNSSYKTKLVKLLSSWRKKTIISKPISLKISSFLAEHVKRSWCIENTSCKWRHPYERGCCTMLHQMIGPCCYALSWIWNKMTSSWKKPVSLQTGLHYAVWTARPCIRAPHSSGK